jgi:hypothetical protein
VVRLFDLLCEWHLAVNAPKSFGARKATSFLEARDLCFAVGGDHDDFVDAFAHANLEEERHFIDNHCMGFPCGDPAHEALLLAGDPGMDDAFELATFPWITEDDPSEYLSVERAVRFEDCRPK